MLLNIVNWTSMAESTSAITVRNHQSQTGLRLDDDTPAELDIAKGLEL